MMVTVYFSQVLFFLGSAAAADIGGGWFGSGPVPWLGGEQQTPFSDEAVAAAASSSIDWVAKGAVTTPISQGRCATCAQFSVSNPQLPEACTSAVLRRAAAAAAPLLHAPSHMQRFPALSHLLDALFAGHIAH